MLKMIEKLRKRGDTTAMVLGFATIAYTLLTGGLLIATILKNP